MILLMTLTSVTVLAEPIPLKQLVLKIGDKAPNDGVLVPFSVYRDLDANDKEIVLCRSELTKCNISQVESDNKQNPIVTAVTWFLVGIAVDRLATVIIGGIK